MHIGYWWGDLIERGLMEDPKCKWQNDIKMGLQEVGWGGMDRTDLAQERMW